MCIIYVIANISKLIKVKIEKSVESTIINLIIIFIENIKSNLIRTV